MNKKQLLLLHLDSKNSTIWHLNCAIDRAQVYFNNEVLKIFDFFNNLIFRHFCLVQPLTLKQQSKDWNYRKMFLKLNFTFGCCFCLCPTLSIKWWHCRIHWESKIIWLCEFSSGIKEANILKGSKLKFFFFRASMLNIYLCRVYNMLTS